MGDHYGDDPIKDGLNYIANNVIDVETKLAETNALLTKLGARQYWEYLHVWRESSGVYRSAGDSGSSVKIQAQADIDVWKMMGLNGWELVQAYVDNSINYIFKRPIERKVIDDVEAPF